jgi:hypothetical protein
MTEDEVRRIALEAIGEVLAGAREAFDLSGTGLTSAEALEAGLAKAINGKGVAA